MRASGIFDCSAASELTVTTSCPSSGSDVLPASRSTGMVGNSGLSGKRTLFFVESTIFDNRAASGVTGMLSGCASGPPGLPVPKSAGMVEEIMLDQHLTKAFRAGLRHSLDDPDDDAMSDL